MPDGRARERYYWSELLRLAGEYYRLWSRIRLGRKAITTTRIAEFRREFERLESWRETLYAEIRGADLWDRLVDVIEDVERERTRVSEEIEKLEVWEIIGTDTVTGYTIYYNPTNKMYYTIDARETIKKRFEKLGVIVTYSIDTGTTSAHERLVCEATAWTFVKGMSSSDLLKPESDLSDFIEDALEYYFNVGIRDVAIKGGAEYASGIEVVGLAAGWSIDLEEVNYPEMVCYLEYWHKEKTGAGKIIKRTYSEFMREKREYPKREHLPKGGRPKKIEEFV